MRSKPKQRITKEQIQTIEDKELNEIAYKYFIQRITELDIAFELNYSEKTVSRRINEVYNIIRDKSLLK